MVWSVYCVCVCIVECVCIVCVGVYCVCVYYEVCVCIVECIVECFALRGSSYNRCSLIIILCTPLHSYYKHVISLCNVKLVI